jgi:crossover junction endodeoxyribonuclease RuvC
MHRIRQNYREAIDAPIRVWHCLDQARQPQFFLADGSAMPLDTRSKIIAIDPGVNGAYAVLGRQGEFVDMNELPRFKKALSAVELASIFSMHRPELAVIEKVASMPGQGVASVFTFGTAYGVCIGVAGGSDVPVSFVTPGRWKAHFRLLGQPKDASRELAIRLYPAVAKMLGLKKHHGRADALLLARFALDTETGAKFV